MIRVPLTEWAVIFHSVPQSYSSLTTLSRDILDREEYNRFAMLFILHAHSPQRQYYPQPLCNELLLSFKAIMLIVFKERKFLGIKIWRIQVMKMGALEVWNSNFEYCVGGTGRGRHSDMARVRTDAPRWDFSLVLVGNGELILSVSWRSVGWVWPRVFASETRPQGEQPIVSIPDSLHEV